MIVRSEQLSPARGLALLVAMFFLPLFARNVFPMVRDKQAITLASSFTDPQMLATYIFALYIVAQLLRYPQAFASLARPPLRLMTLWAALALVSVAASTFPLFSLWRVTLLLLALAWCALLVARINDADDGAALFSYFYRALMLIQVCVLIGVVLDPAGAWFREASGVNRLRASEGFYIGPNELGVISAVVALGAYARLLLRFRIGWALAGVGALVMCYLTHSRTAYAIVVLGGFALSVAMLQLPTKRFAVLALTSIVAVLVAGVVVVDHDLRQALVNLITRQQMDSNLNSLGGRTGAWELGWRAFLSSPWIGSGYGTYPGWFYNDVHGHFHNWVVESLVTLGIVGTIPVVVLLLVVVKGVMQTVLGFGRMREGQHLLAADLIVVGVAIVLANQTSSAAAYYSSHMIALCVWLVAFKTLQLSWHAPPDIVEERHAASHAA